MTDAPAHYGAKLVIIYGSLRAGTTLIRLMIDSHSGLVCHGEADFLFDYLTRSEGCDYQLDAGALDRDRTYRETGIRADETLAPVAAICKMVVDMQGGGDEVLVLILHRGLEHAINLFPHAIVVHMVRDPRDVAHSSIGMGWAGNSYYGIVHWVKTETEWDRVQTREELKDALTITYEALITNTRETLGDLMNHCSMEFEEAMLEYPLRSTYSAPDASLIEQWRHTQTPRELALLESRINPMMRARGYIPSQIVGVVPGSLERGMLAVTNKMGVWRQRIGRFGLIDPLLVGFSKRLRLPALGYGAQRRIDERVITRYLK